VTTSPARSAATVVVVADARPVVACGLAAALTGHGLLDASAATTDGELAAAVRARAPAVVLVPVSRSGELPELFGCALRVVPARTDVVVVGPASAGRPAGARAVLAAGSPVSQLATGIAELVARPGAAGAPRWPSTRAEPVGPAPGEGAVATLTARERDVLELLGRGRSTREIAEELSVSVNTVRTHVNVVLHKLGVHSRLRAVALFTDGSGR